MYSVALKKKLTFPYSALLIMPNLVAPMSALKSLKPFLYLFTILW